MGASSKGGWLLGSKFTDGDTAKAISNGSSILRQEVAGELIEDGYCNSILAVGPKIDGDKANTVGASNKDGCMAANSQRVPQQRQ